MVRASPSTHGGDIELIQLRYSLERYSHFAFGSFIVWIEIAVLTEFLSNGGNNSILIPRRIHLCKSNQSSIQVQKLSFADEQSRHADENGALAVVVVGLFSC